MKKPTKKLSGVSVIMIAIAVIALSAGGCGGGSPSPAPTATAPAAPPESTAALELRHYLIRSNEARKQYRKALDIADQYATAIPVGATRATRAQLDRSDGIFRAAARTIEASAVAQLQAKAPAPLRAINRKFANYSTRIGSHYRDLALTLKNMSTTDDFAKFNAATEKFPDFDVRAEWRTAVQAYAAEIDAPTPSWLARVGKPTGGGD